MSASALKTLWKARYQTENLSGDTQTDFEAFVDGLVDDLASAGVFGGSGMVCITFYNDPANLLNIGPHNSAEFLDNVNRSITRADLSGFTQCRIVIRVTNTNADGSDPRLRVAYKTGAYSGTVGDYSDIADSGECEVTLGSGGINDSGWVDMASGAQADSINLAVIQDGGVNSDTANIGNIQVFFQ